MLIACSKSRPAGGVENAGAARGGRSVWAEAAQSTTTLGHPSQGTPGRGCCLVATCVTAWAGTNNDGTACVCVGALTCS